MREQTIGGFTQVGAHGTGVHLSTVDDQVIAMRLVTPSKGTITLSKVCCLLRLWNHVPVCSMLHHPQQATLHRNARCIVYSALMMLDWLCMLISALQTKLRQRSKKTLQRTALCSSGSCHLLVPLSSGHAVVSALFSACNCIFIVLVYPVDVPHTTLTVILRYCSKTALLGLCKLNPTAYWSGACLT